MKQRSGENKISDDELRAVFNEFKHIGKIAAFFEIPHVSVWRRLKKLGLKTESKTGSKIPLSEILDGQHPYYQTYKLNLRLIREGLMKNECSVCGISEWNGKEIKMQLDHINGNSSDHRLENLRMICPNCHSQTETYCGKNI